MKTDEFNLCRDFLEKAILKNPENSEFLQAYQKLIELKSIYDKETDKARIEKEIREAEYNSTYQATVHTNNTEYNKATYQNNTDFNIAANTNQATSFQHQQTQFAGVANNVINNGWLPNPR